MVYIGGINAELKHAGEVILDVVDDIFLHTSVVQEAPDMCI